MNLPVVGCLPETCRELQMNRTIEMSGTATIELGTDSNAFYDDYWKEGDVVSQDTKKRNRAVLDTCFSGKIEDKRILEIGIGGEGGILLSLARHNEVHGIDVSASARRNCEKLGLDIELRNLDTDGLPFHGDFFDVAFSFEVFEHFANPQFVIEEVKRVLKPRGLFVLSTPSPLTHHWPRLFYPELFEETAFREFLMINKFQILKRVGWGENHYSDRIGANHLKAWSWIWACENMGNDRPDILLEYGKYFWEQKDAAGNRRKPMEAIDLLRSAYELDENLIEARWLLTLALTYRFINGEKEEYLENINRLVEGANCEGHPHNMLCTYYLIAAHLELKPFGTNLVPHDRLADLIRHLSELPDSGPCVKDVMEALGHNHH